MTGNGAFFIHLPGPGAVRRRRIGTGGGRTREGRVPGRHRIGGAGLHHCGEIGSVRQRLDAGRETGQWSRHRRRQPLRLGRRITVAVAAAGVLLVSGWYAAAAAAAVATMLSP
ncbi:MAG TPA: hypothetical protein VK453_22870 [Micromonosporaceae bacterium]|nr:hypothetical protein [Micromonosporaceae bacterium]